MKANLKWLVVFRTDRTMQTKRVLNYFSKSSAEKIAADHNRSNQDTTWDRLTAFVEENEGQDFPVVVGQ